MLGLGESRNCIRGYFLLERQRPRSLIILLLIRDFGVCSFCTLFSLGLITSQKSWSDESCNLASPLRPVGALCGMKMFILSAVFWLVVLCVFFCILFSPWALTSVSSHLYHLFICHSSPSVPRCSKLTWYMDSPFPRSWLFLMWLVSIGQ